MELADEGRDRPDLDAIVGLVMTIESINPLPPPRLFTTSGCSQSALTSNSLTHGAASISSCALPPASAGPLGVHGVPGPGSRAGDDASSAPQLHAAAANTLAGTTTRNGAARRHRRLRRGRKIARRRRPLSRSDLNGPLEVETAASEQVGNPPQLQSATKASENWPSSHPSSRERRPRARSSAPWWNW
jgi:hypothetical protein